MPISLQASAHPPKGANATTTGPPRSTVPVRYIMPTKASMLGCSSLFGPSPSLAAGQPADQHDGIASPNDVSTGSMYTHILKREAVQNGNSCMDKALQVLGWVRRSLFQRYCKPHINNNRKIELEGLYVPLYASSCDGYHPGVLRVSFRLNMRYGAAVGCKSYNRTDRKR